jgi:hypothetical protein
MAIPAKPSVDSFPFHGLVARIDVFDRPGNKMPEVRETSSERRTIVEHIFIVRAAVFYRFLKYIIVFPEFLDFLLHSGKFCLRIYLMEHLRVSCSSWDSACGLAKAKIFPHVAKYRHFRRYIQSVLTIVSIDE